MGFTQTPQTAPQNRPVNRQSSIPVSQSFSFATSSPATTSTGMSLRKRTRTFGVDEPYKKGSHNHRKRAKIDHPAQNFGDELPEIALDASHTATRERRAESEVTGDNLTPTAQRRRATSCPFALASPKTEEPEVTDSFPAEVALPTVDISRLSQPTHISGLIAGPEENADGEQSAQATTYPDISIGAISPEVRDPRGGIGDTTEWKLIYGLRQSSDRFADRQGLPRQPDAVGVGSTGILELQTALRNLNIQIHTTFTILRLELLLHLESELEDDASQPNSESELDDDSRWSGADSARDDSSSQSSVKSDRIAPSEERFNIPGHSPSPSGNQTLSRLWNLCSLLEARVNPLLIPVEPRDSDQTPGYPRLMRLVGYVQSLPIAPERLEFIPIPRSRLTPFLFNITEDAAIAEAFVKFSNGTQKRPRGETRKRMLEEAESMRDRFLDFNNFVNSLQISPGSLNNLATRPNQSSTSTKSFASFALLQKFQQQTAAACRAIFSQVGSCAHQESMEHKILLQLPGWEDVSDCHSTDVKQDLPVQLFFTRCTHNDWQHARMYFLRPEHTNACRRRKLCRALSSAHNDDRDLEFYVSEDSQRRDPGEIPIHIPINPKRHRRYGDSFPNSSDSLWTLVEKGYFEKEPTMNLLRHTSGKGGIVGIEQRRALAVKLVLGLMLSMDSDHIIDTWDPKHIHFLEPVDTKYTPFVSIYGNRDSSSLRHYLSLPKLYTLGDVGDDDDDPKPLPPFALLAKALLHIACGEPLRGFEISQVSESAFRDAWKTLRRMVERYIRLVTCGEVVDRETLPFLHAAQSCLDFHTLYQERVTFTRSNHRMEVAWKLVFDKILARIDNKLTLGELVESRTDALTKEEPVPAAGQTAKTQKEERQPSQPEVVLFDGEDAAQTPEKIQWAVNYWERLDEFHDSYSSFVLKRDIDSGEEPPRRIRIAVLDTGIDFRHPGIMDAKANGRVKEEWCHSWVGADAKDEDDGLHGTNCAYLLHKAAPEADIYVEKVFEYNRFRSYHAKNIAKAINHAVKTWDVDILSMSFGLRGPPQDLVEDIETTIRKLVTQSPRIMFAAASNSGKNEGRAFPASCDPWVICVHASDGNGGDGGINPPPESGANFMTLGMGHELMERKWSVEGGRRMPKYQIVYRSGTSFATPVAAGVAATVLDLAARVKGINDQARRKLKRSEGMVKMLRLMSTPKHDFGQQYCYLAPWNHWKTRWQEDEEEPRMAWGSINALFKTR